MPSIITTATKGTMNSNEGYNNNSKKSDNIETSNYSSKNSHQLVVIKTRVPTGVSPPNTIA